MAMTTMTTLNQTPKKQWNAEFMPRRVGASPNVTARPDKHWISTSPLIQLNHISRITYALPVERVRSIIPSAFGLQTQNIGNKEFALLTIESFLDQGSQTIKTLAVQAKHEAFEQTNYRIHARLNDHPCGWLIGASLGSLTAVASRHLWPAPWHLSAMEFQVAYDALNERYQHYRLRTQSQWANAYWELSDSGISTRNDFTSESDLAMPDYFIRRDGSLGLHKVTHEADLTTQAELRSARCDLLERLGLLTTEELMRPIAVTLQRNVRCRIDAKAKPPIASAA